MLVEQPFGLTTYAAREPVPVKERIDVHTPDDEHARQAVFTRNLPQGVESPVHSISTSELQCHSDNVADPEEAKLVQVSTLKAHGVVVNEKGL